MTGSIIAVGIDGSEGSRRALRWAIDEAVLRNGAVEAVTVWPPRGSAEPVSDDQAEQMRLHADEMQRHVVASVLDGIENPPSISREVVHGDAIDVLVRMSSHADLLVVGSHGVSSMRHAALGSVSEACARLAECPSVVVPVNITSEHGEELTVV